MPLTDKQKAWSLDQLTKSIFFHQKLHEWGMLEVADAIDAIKGETLEWEWEKLGISQDAWNKVIHRGIKPIIIFAHPHILRTIPRSTSYYRMLSMVSQKSMNGIGLSAVRYEQSDAFPVNSGKRIRKNAEIKIPRASIRVRPPWVGQLWQEAERKHQL